MYGYVAISALGIQAELGGRRGIESQVKLRHGRVAAHTELSDLLVEEQVPVGTTMWRMARGTPFYQ